MVSDCPGDDGLAHIVGCRARFQACVDAASAGCLNHNPRFGFSALARWNQIRLRVAGMHLDRKHFVRIEKFEEQRKAAEARSKISHEWFPELFHHFTECASFQPSVGNLAWMIVAVTEHPRFAYRTVTG